MTQFAWPLMFLLLPLPFIVRAVLPAVKGLYGDALRVPFLGDLEKISIKSGSLWNMGSSSNPAEYSKFFWLTFLVWLLLVTAAARPQKVGEPVRLPAESRDIMLVLDISNSMLEQDFTLGNYYIDRLTAVKKTAADFLKKRADDRVGLILFGTRAYLQAPLTYDKKSVQEIIALMDAGMAGTSTAIGDALGLALKNMRGTQDADNKIIILLTDGENNDGSLSLGQAIKLAQDEKIKIYTIGVGKPGGFFGSLMGITLGGNSGLDEAGLKALAAATKGTYFRAEDTAGLQKIYDTIDKLNPRLNDDRFIQETSELFYIPLLAAVLLSMGLAAALRRIN